MKRTFEEVLEMEEEELHELADENGLDFGEREFEDLEEAAKWLCSELDIAANGDEDDDDEEEEKKKEEEEEEEEDEEEDEEETDCRTTATTRPRTSGLISNLTKPASPTWRSTTA